MGDRRRRAVGMILRGGIAYLTAGEMAEVDREATKDFGIEVAVLMELAGLSTAKVASKMLGGSVAGKSIACLVGKGNNGGDGLVAARHLSNWGGRVSIVLGESRSDLRDAPSRQLKVTERMGIQVRGAEDIERCELAVDALLGYGSSGDPREPVAGLILKANASGKRILAVDLPSGLDATSGEPGDPCIKAAATVTFGLPKTGFLAEQARPYLGELYLADISLPAEVLAKYAQPACLFGEEPIIKIG